VELKERIIKTVFARGQIALFYLGQEGFLLKYENRYILIDAYLSDYVDRFCGTDKISWKRNYAPPISGKELDFADIIICTHAHADHADPITIKEILGVNQKAKFIVSKSFTGLMEDYGVPPERIIPAAADESFEFCGIKFTPVPAAHESLNMDSDGNYAELGYIIELGGIRVFHAGDCCVYDGLAERIAGVDIALLPINGRDYFRLENDIIGNMDSREAVLLAKTAGAGLLVPMHFDLYRQNGASAAHFTDCVYEFGGAQPFHIFMPGERYIYEK